MPSEADRATLFDLDDTLYPEREYVRSGFRAVAVWADQNLGIPMGRGFAELESLFDGGERAATFELWLSNNGFNPDAWSASFVEVFRSHFPLLSPYPEVRRVLRSLSRTRPLGLVSDGRLEAQQRKIDALGISSYFSCIVLTDQWGRDSWKPSPRGFEEALARLGIEPSQAAYVGDNPRKDFVAPKRLGMKTIRVRRQDGLYSLLEPSSAEEAPDIEISTLDGLTEALHRGT